MKGMNRMKEIKKYKDREDGINKNGYRIELNEYEMLEQDKDVRDLHIDKDDHLNYARSIQNKIHSWGTAINDRLTKDRAIEGFNQMTSIENIKEETRKFGKEKSYGILG